MRLARGLLHGAAAGAAGTTALNAVTYLDMALRARPASTTPQQAADTLADKTGHPIPGDGETKQNRLAGLGPLIGLLTGVSVGALAGTSRPLLARLPNPAAAALLGLGVMLATDGTLVSLGLTNPKKWSPQDWAADLIPHLAYGAISYATLQATGPAD